MKAAVKTFLRMTVTVVWWCLAIHWVMFIGYSIAMLIEGGPVAVIGWYRHITNPGLTSAAWSGEMFLFWRITLLAITITIWYLWRQFSRGSRSRPSTK